MNTMQSQDVIHSIHKLFNNNWVQIYMTKMEINRIEALKKNSTIEQWREQYKKKTNTIK